MNPKYISVLGHCDMCTGYRKTIGIYTIQQKLEVNSRQEQSAYRAHGLRRNLQKIKGEGE
jgi:hypothetical protein